MDGSTSELVADSTLFPEGVLAISSLVRVAHASADVWKQWVQELRRVSSSDGAALDLPRLFSGPSWFDTEPIVLRLERAHLDCGDLPERGLAIQTAVSQTLIKQRIFLKECPASILPFQKFCLPICL